MGCGGCCAAVVAVPELGDEVEGPRAAGLGVGNVNDDGCAFAGAGRVWVPVVRGPLALSVAVGGALPAAGPVRAGSVVEGTGD